MLIESGDSALLDALPSASSVERELKIERAPASAPESPRNAASAADDVAAPITDPALLPAGASTVDLVDAVTCSGWLMKQSPAFHKVSSVDFYHYVSIMHTTQSMQRRYFVLKSHYLFYSKGEQYEPIGLLKLERDAFINLPGT
jgi:hypothetical protein